MRSEKKIEKSFQLFNTRILHLAIDSRLPLSQCQPGLSRYQSRPQKHQEQHICRFSDHSDALASPQPEKTTAALFLDTSEPGSITQKSCQLLLRARHPAPIPEIVKAPAGKVRVVEGEEGVNTGSGVIWGDGKERCRLLLSPNSKLQTPRPQGAC